jgi:hypothetical protein
MTVALSEFLGAFFPDENEAICFRAFKPKEVPDTELNQARKFAGTRAQLRSDDSFKNQLKNMNQVLGLYFVVNSGGQTKEEINRFNAFFVESDTTTIEEQHIALDNSPLQPSIRVQTKKSVHAYWLISGECSKEEWCDIQTRLIEHFNGDEKIKDPPRVMRLPLFYHLSLNGGTELHRQRVEIIVFEPEKRFTVTAMQQVFKAVLQKSQASEYSRGSGYGGDFYSTWEALGDEARRRMLSHPTAHYKGEWVECRGVCHDGKSSSALTFNLVSGKYFCRAGCTKEAILTALGLPERPQSIKHSEHPRSTERRSESITESHSEGRAEQENSQESPTNGKPEGIFTVEDLSDEIDALYETGLQPGEHPGWDNLAKLYTIKKGQFSVVTGTPGAGKSAVLDALLINLANKSGWRFAVCSFENQPVEQHMATLLSLYTGEPFSQGPTPRMSVKTKDSAKQWLHRNFTFLLPPEDDRTISGLLSRAEWTHRNRGIDGVVIDPWNEIEHRRPAGMSETEYTSLVLSKLRSFARKNDLHLWLVGHPTKLYRNKDGKYPIPTLYDISGSAHFKNKADFGVVVSRDISIDSNPTIIHVQKVRFRWCGQLGEASLYFDKVTGRYREYPGTVKYTINSNQSNSSKDEEDEIL